MKKLIIFAGAMLLLAAGTVGFFANRPMSAEEALILRNAEAIAQAEQFGDIVIVFNYKNKWWGLAAGCKAKDGHTCTVKDFNWPDLSFLGDDE